MTQHDPSHSLDPAPASPGDTAATLRGVGKAYPHFELKDIDLSIPRGCVAGLIGPNGAGKSTTMRILMGLVQPDRGSVSVLGQPISSRHAAAKQEIGYFADEVRLYKAETVGWHMQFVRALYPRWDDAYAAQLLSRFGLVAEQRVRGLSHGQRVKALLLLILARHPQLLILDEPTNGLDPVAKHEVLTELMRVVEDDRRTILYSSHHTQDIEQISDSITFIDRGQVIASEERDAFLESWRRIKLQVGEDWQRPPIDGLHVDSAFRTLRICTVNHFDDAVLAALQRSGAAIESVEPMTLEEIFVSAVALGREGAVAVNRENAGAPGRESAAASNRESAAGRGQNEVNS